jgi:DNA-binding XRE family transcriptional regulator
MPPADAYRAAAVALIPCLPEAVLVLVLGFLAAQLTTEFEPGASRERIQPKPAAARSPDPLWQSLMAAAATMPRATLAKSLKISESTLRNWRNEGYVPEPARKRVAAWIRMHAAFAGKTNGGSNGAALKLADKVAALDIEAIQAAAEGRSAEELATAIGISRASMERLLEAEDVEACQLNSGERKRIAHWLEANHGPI